MNKELLAALGRISEEESRILQGKGSVEQRLYTDTGRFEVDSAKMLSRGELIQIRTHTRFVHFPRHTHNYIEMVYMCAGSTHHIVSGTDVFLRPGDILIMNQNAVQEILPAGREDIAVNFIILPEFFDETLRMMGNETNLLKDFLISCLKSGSTPVSYLHFEVADVLPIQNLLENLVWTLASDRPPQHMINKYTMGLLFLELMGCTEKLHTSRRSYDHEIVLRSLEYIEAHYREGELGELAALLGCEMTWLSRTIKRVTGFTYLELLQQKRMDMACQLLSSTPLTVADVGLAVGYENISYFHRLFQKYYGITPRKYRLVHRNDGAGEAS